MGVFLWDKNASRRLLCFGDLHKLKTLGNPAKEANNCASFEKTYNTRDYNFIQWSESVLNSVFITGGLGFIGSAVVRHLMATTSHKVVVIDAMTYAAMPEAVAEFSGNSRYAFEQCDICDQDLFRHLLDKYKPSIVMHLAAESHVDRSIDGPAKFIQTNVVGTVQILEACRTYHAALSACLLYTSPSPRD